MINRLISKEFNQYLSERYVILDVGTNDNNFLTYKNNMILLINAVKALGKIPILVTVTPRSSFPINEINQWVRALGELYIDKNRVINNGNENSWNVSYVLADNVHPNELGNAIIFKRMLFDLYPFYSTKNYN